ncbi:NAD-dependent epimerase/dehydratase family protein [Salinarimonas soli]|uniref:NAD(P)H-binding protein n=1 Tax=Salinarimonas soli TaxID=1638099 RepID=A0A5B2VHB1_9HYPH|nr:NAD-dependent epimerase/dehydratase family protein [Salinarimonas soli]KAA2237870.1 NAD(P)H-binding protein [Salinarimonas soli]
MARPLIALTGATGFVGRFLVRDLTRRGYRVRALLRRPADLPPETQSAVVGDLAAPRHMAEALREVDAVIHSAGLAHAMSGIPEDDYRSANTEATQAMARAAERAGIRRFVFLSSIRAQSGPTAPGVLTEADEPRPTDAYGRSKLAAERGLAETGLDWAALRPVLVYGEGVRGNMGALVRLAGTPYPLPFARLAARRSLLALDNLGEAVDVVLRHEGRLAGPFLVADPDPLTLPEIVAALRAGLGRRPGLLPVPASLLGAAMRLAGRSEAHERLAGSLVADPAALRALGWTPRVSTRDGLAALAREAFP